MVYRPPWQKIAHTPMLAALEVWNYIKNNNSFLDRVELRHYPHCVGISKLYVVNRKLKTQNRLYRTLSSTVERRTMLMRLPLAHKILIIITS